MDTNFQMVKRLDTDWRATSHTNGVVTMSEIYLINKLLCLDEMDILQLRNLRDFIVLYFSSKKDTNLETMDEMSAFVSVIDNKIWNKGGEV